MIFGENVADSKFWIIWYYFENFNLLRTNFPYLNASQ